MYHMPSHTHEVIRSDHHTQTPGCKVCSIHIGYVFLASIYLWLMRDYVCSVNGLHRALAHTYYCTVVSIYDMTLTTHSVMCHIHIWNIILYLVLELPFAHFGNTPEHTMLRIQLSIFYVASVHDSWYIKVLYGSHIYTHIYPADNVYDSEH